MAHISFDCVKYGRVHLCPCCHLEKVTTKKLFTKFALKEHLETKCEYVKFICLKECKLMVQKKNLKAHNCLKQLKERNVELEKI